jgi:broad specificity phosphatase PhoE
MTMPLTRNLRMVEVRRHSYTKKGESRGVGSHLSADGVRLARAVGAETGPFEYVAVSAQPRTLETAIAMGYAVDAIGDVIGDVDWDGLLAEVGHHEWWAWEHPFAMFAATVKRGGATTRLGEAVRTAWLDASHRTGAGGSALVVSHGRVIETGLVTCFPDADHRLWGASFSHCEGVRIQLDGDRFLIPELLRLQRSQDGPIE